MNKVAVIGGGPAGLMAADVLSKQNVSVDLYEAKPSVGRKFLVAGKGGLNITNGEPFESFVSRYGAKTAQIRSVLQAFGPNDVKEWCHGLGIETTVGASNRIFPKDLKAAPLLQQWVKRLKEQGVHIHTSHCWQGWDQAGHLKFQTAEGSVSATPHAIVMTLGGASWPKTGSDGKWMTLFKQLGISVAEMQPSNCGFDVQWSDHFSERNAGQPLKSVGLKFTDSNGQTFDRQGACMITKNGIEGSLIYAASAMIRDELKAAGSAAVLLDLAPGRSVENLTQRLSLPRKSKTISSHLRSKAKIHGVAAGLLREFAADTLQDPVRLAAAIKNLPVPVLRARPIEEAISTAGGVRFETLDESLMVTTAPGLFCAGEMLDWEAPTGGYLLTASLASGHVAGQAAAKWVNGNSQPEASN